MAFVELENVTKTYAGAGPELVKALDGVSFSAGAGEWILTPRSIAARKADDLVEQCLLRRIHVRRGGAMEFLSDDQVAAAG